jgi:hypothetical protein
MDIEDAFTSEAIERYDTNVDGVLEVDLRTLIQQVYTTNQLPSPNEDHLNVAVLCFVAGRTYQVEESPGLEPLIEIPMTPDEVHEYIAYLSKKGTS